MSNKRKAVLLGSIIVLLLIVSTMFYNAYAGGGRISLNSPVSFPVDI